jgi:hypothetical protein
MSTVRDAQSLLELVLEVNPATFSRTHSGVLVDFSAAEAPAKATVELFQKIQPKDMEQLPQAVLDSFTKTAQTFLDTVQKIRHLNVNNDRLLSEREGLIAQIRSTAFEAIKTISPIVTYLDNLRGGTALFEKLKGEFDSGLKRISEADEAIARALDEASRAIEAGKSVAAQSGVTQQAYYFQKESEIHDREAKVWKNYIRWLAAAAFLLLGLALSLYKWSWLTPSDAYQAVQLSLSKALIFSTIAYLLILSARNFLAHQHNAVVNRHRQNALQTFEALVNAAGPEKRDIVLTHAAACIFGPQETGYTKVSPQTNVTGLVESIPRIMHSGQ